MAIPRALMWGRCSSEKGECTFSKRWFLQMGNWQEGLFPDLWWSATDLQTEKLEVSLTERACARCWMSVLYIRSPQAFQRFRWAVSPCVPLRWCRQLVWALDSTKRFRFDIIYSVLCSSAATWMLPAFVTAPGELTGWKLVISNNSLRAQYVWPKPQVSITRAVLMTSHYIGHMHMCVYLCTWDDCWKILQNWLS